MKPLSYYCNISPNLEEQVTGLTSYDKEVIIAALAVDSLDTPWSKGFSDLMNSLASLSYPNKLGLIIGLAHQLQPQKDEQTLQLERQERERWEPKFPSATMPDAG